MRKILLIDDDQAVLNYLNVLLMQNGDFDVQSLNTSSQAPSLLKKKQFDLLLLDMVMPEVSGIDILRYIRENNIDLPSIVLTGVEDIEMAVTAMKLGAIDYLTKPLDTAALLRLIKQTLAARHPAAEEVVQRSATPKLQHPEVFQDILTSDPRILQSFETIEKIAPSDSSVLIWGESGTGKELVAQAIHRLSRRQGKRFIAVNAGAFASELFVSEFFGHDKGAFTGASVAHRGFLEEADGGTLFLDEIGELALPIQVKLLRVLQEGEFFRLGSTQHIKVDVRILAATNKNLLEEIKRGNFRKDLFYRLNMNSIYLPPLRERSGDILLLATHFLKRFSAQNEKRIDQISDSVKKLLLHYEYPGNVRELMNIINSAVIIETTTELKKRSLPQYFLDHAGAGDESIGDLSLKTLQDVEKDHIQKILRATGGNKTKAAKILGISRIGLISKIKKLQIE